ncbi:enoyl-CoA hydratase/isomerase family protein [Janibacter sp. GXQ6167]|uniref:enoyl-CoA hydratase/isomerase family protein n=1 Tax=Janibacter sp. GXQ6167 TaxID=3240791 RepID=UPI003524E304
MSEPELLVERVGDVTTMSLNRPKQLNAMTETMVADIIAAAEQAGRDGSRALLVRAEGRAFCAGRDLAGSQPGTEDGGEVLNAVFNPMVRAVADLTIPTIAAVQGACLGTGLGLALACDVILVADSAKIGSPFAKIGAVLDSGGHKAFVDRLGPAVALDLMYSGRFLSGTEAASAGLVSRAVAADELDATAREYALAVSRGPLLAFQESKALVRELSDEGLSLAESLEREVGAQSRSSRTADYVEGFTAFLERREPTFRGE